MTNDLANLEETKRSLYDIRFELEKLERIENQLQKHYENLLVTREDPTNLDENTFGKGWLPDPRDNRDYDAPDTLKLDTMTFAAKQSHIIDQSKFTEIKNQGSLGACTAFAGCSQLEYYVKKKTGADVNLSELFLYLETRRNLGWEKRDTGAYLRTVMKTMASIGTCLEKEWPYNIAKFSEDPPAHIYPRADDYKADSYFKIDKNQYSKDQVLSRIKSVINRNMPLIFGFTCYSNALRQGGSSGDIPYPNFQDSVSGGHAVLLVGYDDGKIITNTQDNSTTTGAFIIRNSWGKTWGDKGRGAIPYEYLLNHKMSDIWCLIRADYLNEERFQ